MTERDEVAAPIPPNLQAGFSRALASFVNWRARAALDLEPVSISLSEERSPSGVSVEMMCRLVMRYSGDMHERDYSLLSDIAARMRQVDPPADRTFASGGKCLLALVNRERSLREMQKREHSRFGLE